MLDLSSLKKKLKKYWPILLIAAAILIFLWVKERNAAPEQEVLPTGIVDVSSTIDPGTEDLPTAGTEPSSKDAEQTSETPTETKTPGTTAAPEFVTEDGEYSDKEHVAAYIHKYNKLPDNYITKAEAEDLGWVSTKGNLWKVAPGKSIGGDRFGNYEGLLPKKKGRTYYECDIDYKGKTRNAKRIIYSNDGLIFYTSDHYETFEQLYDGPGN